MCCTIYYGVLVRLAGILLIQYLGHQSGFYCTFLEDSLEDEPASSVICEQIESSLNLVLHYYQ